MSEPEIQSDDSLDARGLVCPEPLMLVRNRVRDMHSGAVLYIQATDPSTGRDFTNFCRFDRTSDLRNAGIELRLIFASCHENACPQRENRRKLPITS